MQYRIEAVRSDPLRGPGVGSSTEGVFDGVRRGNRVSAITQSRIPRLTLAKLPHQSRIPRLTLAKLPPSEAPPYC